MMCLKIYYIYVCVCVCMYIYEYILDALNPPAEQMSFQNSFTELYMNIAHSYKEIFIRASVYAQEHIDTR